MPKNQVIRLLFISSKMIKYYRYKEFIEIKSGVLVANMYHFFCFVLFASISCLFLLSKETVTTTSVDKP